MPAYTLVQLRTLVKGAGVEIVGMIAFSFLLLGLVILMRVHPRL